MLPADRRARIVAALNGTGVLATEDLAERFDVSTETIRRDVTFLERQGQLVRVHGGAMSRGDAARVNAEAPFDTRVDEQHEAKVRIGQAAAALVRDGDVVAIDVGTTSVEVARALPHTFSGVVATPSLLVAAELAGRSGVEVLLSGGRVRGGDLACSNAQAVAFFRDIHTDIAFLSSGGVSIGAGLTDFYREEIVTRRQILENANKAFILADSSKVGRVAPYRVCELREAAGLVTDAEPPATFREAVVPGFELIVG